MCIRDSINIKRDQAPLTRKRRCGRYDVKRFFYFCNPSTILAPFLPPSLLFKDLNLQYFARRPKLHLLILKQLEKKTFSVFEFQANSGPTLASKKQIGRQIVEQIDDCKRKMSVTAGKQVSAINGGGQMIIFSNTNHLFENHEKMRRSWMNCLREQSRFAPPEMAMRERIPRFSRTHLSTFETHLRRLQPQGVSLNRLTKTDVSWIRRKLLQHV